MIWYILFVAAVTFLARLAWKSLPEDSKMDRIATPIMVLLVVVCWLSPVYYEWPGVMSSVVTFDGDKATLRPYGAFAWEWGEFSNVPDVVLLESSVTSLTTNPKVRQVKVRLEINVSEPSLFYLDHGRRLHSGGSMAAAKLTNIRKGVGSDVIGAIQEVVACQLFEFNNAHSTELSRFYNPLDNDQIKGMKELVEPWLNERLAKDGLRVTMTSFTLE